MKHLHILLFALLALTIGCASEPENKAGDQGSNPAIQSNTQSSQPTQSESMIGDVNFQNGNQTAQPTTPPRPQEPPQNADGVWHYTCPNGCEGGAGSATECSKCGTRLKHNVAYHSNPGATPNSPVIQSPAVNGQPATPKPQSAPQNAAGEWHYACATAGCGGGAGGPGTCPKCGAALKHNTAYHN